METERGHLAVGWLVVQDLLMILVLVMLPAVAAVSGRRRASRQPARYRGTGGKLGLTIAKVAGFIAFMLVVGRRAIPMLLHYVAHTGSRELFRLAVLSVALGVAFVASQLFERVVRARRLLRRHDPERIGAEPGRRPRNRCRCAMRSRCCSSSRSGCCSTRRSWSTIRCRSSAR